ncbi:hypothetical protein ACTXT7_008867 [Hymenolepis weldensis]
MTTQFLFPRLPSTAPYRSFRLKDPNFSTLQQQRRRPVHPTKPDLQMLSSTLLCTSMTLQPPPVTSFRIRNCRCSSLSFPPKPPECPKRPSNLAINQNQTTSFSKKSAYAPPLPSPAENAPQSAPPMKTIPSPLIINDFLPQSPLSVKREGEKDGIGSPPSRTFSSFSPPTSSLGSTVTTPVPSTEDEEESVDSPTCPCKSILKRSTGEMGNRLVTAPSDSGRMDTPVPVCFSQSLSAMSQKGVRFDVERNSLHTYERDGGDGFLVNGVKKIRLARNIFQTNLHHKADK